MNATSGLAPAERPRRSVPAAQRRAHGLKVLDIAIDDELGQLRRTALALPPIYRRDETAFTS